ncbi:MAG: hypothetical protein HFI09_04490, partial [Bacilli bacterium]|nr:hypothetical protein [Bacilli bacterium]
MKTEKMNELAKDFLREYSFCYKLDLLELVDCEELTKAIDTLEAEECKYFMDKHNINVLEFSQFRQAVQNNLEEFINEERGLLNKTRSDRQHVITKFINEVDNHKNFEQNDLLIKELYQIINNMPLEEFVDYISEYATIHNNPYFMENLNEEESLREAGILKEELLDEMKNHYSFLINNSNNDLNETESAISNENGALESTFDQNKIEKFMDDLIA